MRLMCTMSTACLVTHEVVCQMNSIDSGMRSMLGRSSDLGAFTPDTLAGRQQRVGGPGLDVIAASLLLWLSYTSHALCW